MYSAAADFIELRPAAPAARAAPAHPWQDFPISEVMHHGQSCCEIAREWVAAMDFAQLNGSSTGSGARWLREKYEWGPSPWPIHWCEIVGRKTIDCGAHSALAHQAFQARGLTAFRAQLVQRYSADAVAQWRHRWTEQSVSDHWLDTDTIYHEANAVMVGSELKLWDSSAGWWIDPREQTGYGSLAAVRVVDADRHGAEAYPWGRHWITPNQWHFLESREDPLP